MPELDRLRALHRRLSARNNALRDAYRRMADARASDDAAAVLAAAEDVPEALSDWEVAAGPESSPLLGSAEAGDIAGPADFRSGSRPAGDGDRPAAGRLPPKGAARHAGAAGAPRSWRSMQQGSHPLEASSCQQPSSATGAGRAQLAAARLAAADSKRSANRRCAAGGV